MPHASTGCWSKRAGGNPRWKKPSVPTGAKYPSGVCCTEASHASERRPTVTRSSRAIAAPETISAWGRRALQ